MANTKKYDWSKWFSKTTKFTLIRGKHYSCSSYSMMMQVRAYATRNKVKVTIKIDEGPADSLQPAKLVVQILGKAGKAKKKSKK